MSTIINIIIFIIVLLCYIHVTDQHKKSEDLEIYEMDYNTNPELQEICNLKQPITFIYDMIDDKLLSSFTNDIFFKGISELKVKNNNDYWENKDSIDYIILPAETALSLFNTDKKSQYFSENNHHLISESNNEYMFEEHNQYLQPTMTTNTKFDIMFGSNNSITPMKYHTDYRHFVYCTKGTVKIKLTPWKSKKFLNPVHDYEEYEFRSKVNVWNHQSEYSNDYQKIKFLEFDLPKGSMLYIPPFWWHSFKFTDNACLCNFTYNSFANSIYNLPNWMLYFIQQSNIKRQVTRTHIIENPDESIEKNEEINEEINDL